MGGGQQGEDKGREREERKKGSDERQRKGVLAERTERG